MNVLMFCSLAAPDIEFYNRLYRYWDARGVKLFVIIFEKFDANLRLLQIPRDLYMHLESSSIDRMSLPTFLFPECNNRKVDEQLLENLLRQECEVYGQTLLSRSDFFRKATAFHNLTEKLLEVVSPEIVFWLFQARPAYTIVRDVLRKHRIRYIDFERWHFPKTYVFSENGIWSPNWRKQERDEVSLENYRMIAKSLFDTAGQWYKLSREEKYVRTEPYILLLTSDGFSTGTATQSSEEFTSLGSSWGNDKDCVVKIESVLDKVWPDCALLVRQHPFSPHKLTSADISAPRTKTASQYSLEDLISNAEAVVCSYTGVIYHALRQEKAVAVLGHHELEGSGVLTCCHDLKDLENWLTKIKMDEDSRKNRLSDIIETTARYMMNSVVSLDHDETFRVLDQYIRESRSEKTQVPKAWQHMRLILNVFKPYFLARRLLYKARRLPSKLKMRIEFGESS